MQEKLVGAGAGVLHALEQLRSLAGVRRAESLAQHHFVIVAARHAFADLLHVGDVLFGRVVGLDGRRLALRRRSDPCRATREAAGGQALALELVAEALHLLFLAIHVPDVVAEVEVQILVAVARQLLFDGLELEQQIVAEGADQAQTRILFAAEFVDQRAQNRKRGGLLAALLFREQRGERLQHALQAPFAQSELLPMRMAL